MFKSRDVGTLHGVTCLARGTFEGFEVEDATNKAGGSAVTELKESKHSLTFVCLHKIPVLQKTQSRSGGAYRKFCRVVTDMDAGF